MTPPLHFALITDSAKFLALGSEWRALEERAKVSPFLSWDYVECWWRAYPKSTKLCIITARDEVGKLWGIAPVVICPGRGKPRRWLRHLTLVGGEGESLSEYLDLIIEPGHEAEIGAAMGAFLRKNLRFGWDILRMNLVCSRSLGVRAFLKHFLGEELEPRRIRRNWLVTLGRTWQEVIETHGKRREWKSTVRKREKLGRPMQLLQAGVDLPLREAFDILVRLNQHRWGDDDHAFKTPEYIQFHWDFIQRLHQAGKLALLILRMDGKDLAAHYSFHDEGKVYFFQAGWDRSYVEYSPGNIMTLYALEWAVQHGMREFDFMADDTGYKARWCRETGTLHDFETSNPHSPIGKIFTAVLRWRDRRETKASASTPMPAAALSRSKS